MVGHWAGVHHSDELLTLLSCSSSDVPKSISITSGESSLAANHGLFNDSLFSLSCSHYFCFASLSHLLHFSQDLNWYPVSRVFLHFDCEHCLVGCGWDFSSMWGVPEYVAKDCLMLRYDTTCILSICTMTIIIDDLEIYLHFK